MNVPEIFNLLVRTPNMNDDDTEGKGCGFSTKLIRKLTDFFLLIIGERASTNIPLSKMRYLIKMAKLTCLYKPMHLPLDDYPQYYDKP